MKKLSILLLSGCLCIGVYSCKKTDNNENTGSSVNANTTTYTVNGVDDINIFQGQNDHWNLAILNRGRIYETINLAIEGLPQGTTATFSTASGIPTFTSTVTFATTNTLPGVYPCKLLTTGIETKQNIYNFNLKVTKAPICGLLQTFEGTSDCDPAFISVITSTAPPIEDSINVVEIANFGGNSFPVFAHVDCSTSSIEIQSQTFTYNSGTITISGSGTFTSGSVITINYNITVNGIPESCTFTMAPQD